MGYVTIPRIQSRELRKAIKGFKQLNLRTVDIDVLKTALAPILHHYVHPAPLIQPGELIFRTVTWGDRPSLMKHLTYPPADKVGYGRCNRPGDPLFYGSTSGISAIQELAPSNGTRLVLSMWRVTQPIFVACVGYSERTFRDFGSKRWSDVWWQKEDLPEFEPVGARTPANNLVNRFLAKEFTKSIPKGESWKYKLSVCISETFLKAKPFENANGEIPGVLRAGESTAGLEVSALVYPSVAAAANNDNIAINSSTSDSSLSFVWAQFLEIERTNEKADEFNPKGLDFANCTTPTGELVWFNHFPNVLVPGTDLRLDLDGGALVLKDSKNIIAGRFPPQ
ncbi:hypothetical protein [Bradyrhizobium sp.]|uniref:hypothetical protein n=1 Tax=Bradyrhizobium sp. TaxID=376 RepID=UPI00271838B7|nr:hypothetical protein [Bradyrhizobium sp.]MDO9296550.1 hypothetical protein [Bradyrhizobium sp.]